MSDYVVRWGEDYMVSNTRVSLASVVKDWKEGVPPEQIRVNFPGLRLAEVYGAIAFYLDHQTEVDAYLTALGEDFERRRAEQRALYPERTAKLRAALETAQR